ncbi:R8 protein [Coemansia sp. IMI 203386]|nr:R8 protein [Coemansia sp. IMI 203386]
MFYSYDLLSRRNGRFGAIWMLANASASRRLGHITNREIQDIDIRRSCLEIIQLPAPLSLRLSSSLLVGIVQAYSRKSNMLYMDSHLTRSRIVSTPYMTSDRGFNPLISCISTTASTKAITLSFGVVPAFFKHTPEVSIDLSDKRYKALGWTRDRIAENSGGDDSGTHVDRPMHTSSPLGMDQLGTFANTVSWDSISIANSIVPRGNASTTSYQHGRFINNQAPATNLLNMPVGCDAGSLVFRNIGVSNHLAENIDPEQQCDIYFSEDGDLQFIPSSDPAVNAGRAESIAEFATKQSIEGGSFSLQMGPEPESLDKEYNSSDSIQGLRRRYSNDTLEQRLEEVENAVFSAWDGTRITDTLSHRLLDSQHARKRQRLGSQPACLTDIDGLFEIGTDYIPYNLGPVVLGNRILGNGNWSAKSRSLKTTVKKRVANAQRMYRVANSVSVMHLFATFSSEPMDSLLQTAENADNISEISSYTELAAYAFADDHGDTSPIYNDIDPEEVRGGSLPVVGPNSSIQDLYLDIPWLNQQAVQTGLERRFPASRSVSVSREASREPSASVQDTPNSYAHTHAHGPPSSEDELEIHSFELVLHNPENPADGVTKGHDHGNELCDQHGLESFLSTRNYAGKSKDQENEVNMDLESRSFKRFVLDRLATDGPDTISFENILLPPFKTRRVAARAFVDLLQMATRSVFYVRQEKPFSEISISRE